MKWMHRQGAENIEIVRELRQSLPVLAERQGCLGQHWLPLGSQQTPGLGQTAVCRQDGRNQLRPLLQTHGIVEEVVLAVPVPQTIDKSKPKPARLSNCTMSYFLLQAVKPAGSGCYRGSGCY